MKEKVCKICDSHYEDKGTNICPICGTKNSYFKFSKDIIVLMVISALVILIPLIINGVKKNSPNEQFVYSEWSWDDYVSISGIKNESFAIKNGTLEIPSTIDGKRVGLGSSALESSNVTTLILPKNLHTVYSDSLKGCTNLKNIVFKGTIDDWKKIDNIEDLDISKYTFTHEGSCDCSEWVTSSGYNCEIGGTKTRACLYCDKVYSESIAPTNHTSVKITGVAPTCTKAGLSDGKECSKCGSIVEAQKTLSALGHEKVIDKAVPATCTQAGLTEGSHCSRCNQVLTQQKTTALASHALGSWEVYWEATCIYSGVEVRSCANCEYEESRDIKPLGHSFNGTTCTICSMPKYSVGLEMTLIEDDFYVVSGMGTCTDKNVVIPDIYNGKQVSAISGSAFWGEDIESIYIPETIWVIEEYAFRNCSNLTSVVIPDNVIELGVGVFKDCNNLRELTLPFVPEYLGYLFVETTGNFGYTDNDTVVPASLTKVSITCWTNIPAHSFAYCENIQEIVLPEFLEIIENSAFSGCESLVKITLPSTLTEIGAYAFSNCKSLTTITIPQNVISIGEKAFEECWELDSVKWVANAKIASIGQSAFWGCSDLTSLTIPKSVIYLGRNVITGCYNLTEVKFEETSGWYCYEYDYSTTTYDIPSKGLSTSSSALDYLYETYEWYQWKRRISSSEKATLQQYINANNFEKFVEETQGLSTDFLSSLSFTSTQKKNFYEFLITRMEYDYFVDEFLTEFSQDEQYFRLIADYTDAGNVVAFADILAKVDDYSYSDNPYMTLFTYNYDDISALWNTKYLRDLFTSEYYLTYYLAGYWRDSSYSNRYIRFYANTDDSSTWCTYNNLEFPDIEYAYWNLVDNELVFCDDNDNVLAKAFKITFVSANQIELYCYQGGKTYTLTRT